MMAGNQLCIPTPGVTKRRRWFPIYDLLPPVVTSLLFPSIYTDMDALCKCPDPATCRCGELSQWAAMSVSSNASVHAHMSPGPPPPMPSFAPPFGAYNPYGTMPPPPHWAPGAHGPGVHMPMPPYPGYMIPAHPPPSIAPAPESRPPAKKRKRPSSSAGGGKRARTKAAAASEVAKGYGAGPPRSVLIPATSSEPADAALTEPSTSAVETCADKSSAVQHVEPGVLGVSIHRMSELQREPVKSLSTAATDVYWFLRALDSQHQPDVWPTNEPILTTRPTSEYVGCKACTTTWKVWQNNSGITSTVRYHLRRCHLELYEDMVQRKGLKRCKSELDVQTSEREEFTQAGFMERLWRWIVADDQSINVVDCPEFRELLLYDAEHLKDGDVPHRTKMLQVIIDAYRKSYNELLKDVQSTLGRVSFTTDIWSDPNLRSYIAITVHYCARDEHNRLRLRCRLLTFCHIEVHHTGQELAKIFFHIIKEAQLLSKMGSITMDSAGNNDTQMVGLEGLFAKEGILFDHDGNRIRCFPHAINRAVVAILDELHSSPDLPLLEDPASLTPELLQQRGAYVAALERQPVKLVRDIVSACRRSGERRAELQRIIADGNEHRQWEDGVKLPAKQLLRDCETRWSSTFMMIGRLLGLYPAVRRLLLEAPENTGLANLTLNTIEQQLLMEIYYILRVAHSCQQVLSTQRTPTLSMALPSYELVMLGWTALKTKYPLLASYIDVGLQRIEKYIALARKSRIYALAMIINPIMKLDWIQEHWKPEDARQARRWIIEVMTAYATQRRHSARERPRVVSQPLPVSVPSSSKNAAFAAAFGEESGMDFLMSVTQEVRGASLLNNHRSTPAPPISTVDTSTSASSAPIEEDIVRAEEDALRADQLCAEHELNKYLDEPPPFYKKEKGPDLVNFWDNAEHRLPLLFKVAMDVLPAQASAVPCERVFSGSKETCTQRRLKMSPVLLGILQVLKFLVKEERLSFTDDLVACEDDYDIDKALTDDAVNELLAAGKYAELEELLKDARRT